MTGGPAPAPAALEREHPEWGRWLVLLKRVRREIGQPAWVDAVGAAAPAAEPAPLLAGVELAVDGARVGRFTRDLLRLAGERALGDEQAVELLEAALDEDVDRIGALATALGVDAAPLEAVARLAATPLLQAAAAGWMGRVSPGWTSGYCPVCGGWPLLAEERGLERARRLRCGRCGADWRGQPLRCPFCDNSDHRRLGTLVSEAQGWTWTVSTCEQCRGYCKTVTTLQPTATIDLGLLDLSTVALDLAAVEAGYRRPPGPGSRLAARVTTRPGLVRRLLARGT